MNWNHIGEKFLVHDTFFNFFILIFNNNQNFRPMSNEQWKENWIGTILEKVLMVYDTFLIFFCTYIQQQSELLSKEQWATQRKLDWNNIRKKILVHDTFLNFFLLILNNNQNFPKIGLDPYQKKVLGHDIYYYLPAVSLDRI